MSNPQKENGYTPIANEIMEALARIRIPGEARQMLDVIIRKTYGFNKKQDQISTSQFMQATGLKRFIIHRARKRLLLSNLITVSKNANSQVITYSFQKDYKKWVLLAKKITVSKNAHNCMQKSAQTVTIIDDHKRHKDTITKDNICIADFFSYFLLKTKKQFKLTATARTLIRQRLNDGFTIAQMKQAVDNFILDDWPERQKHLDLVYCIGVRNKIDNLEKWLNYKPKDKNSVESFIREG
jgi:phage replication O-like protein O